ncbi:hypothetical protein [Aquimarina sp. MMG016]|uniref:hypothetical protein n=1 Tax=Aquimarina sp. MMG016 TaxID=2822690 RepID=UPI001B3A6EA8|nr:hypothetical protein [Aquimarina sp. MMG016]MBQ4821509.1 hypothetical protein [Aquimarina sp. MMG016]
MIKKHHIFAKWRKQDVEYLKNFGINIRDNYDSFLIPENEIYFKIIDHFTSKSLFKKQPPEFSFIHSLSEFSKEELDKADRYILNNIGKPKGYPQPKNGYKEKSYSKLCSKCCTYNSQISLFRIKNEPKWGKNQVHFSLNWIFDETFIKKDFFQEVFAPLGLKSRDVLIHNTGKPAETVLQLVIPEAESDLQLDGSTYDTQKFCPVCGIKKYDQRNLDFMPPFRKDFDFMICKTKESFGETETHQANRKIIISKEFCNLLVKHEIIKYNTYDLLPVRSS